MKINFTPSKKIFKTILCSSLLTAAGVVAVKNSLPKIKELDDAEFEQMKVEINKKKSKLNKNNQSIFQNLSLNKYNIQCLNTLMVDNKTFYRLYHLLPQINNIYSAKFFIYELQHKKEIDENVRKDFILNSEFYNLKTQEQLDFKKSFLDCGIKNPEIGRNDYFAEILNKAENMDEAKKMLEHIQKYGVMPSKRDDLEKEFGENTSERMLEELAKVKDKYNLNLQNFYTSANTYNEPYKIYRSKNSLFRFDPKTGEIVTLEKENQNHNFKNKTVTTVTPRLIKQDNEAFLDSNKLLEATIEIRTFDGNSKNQYDFKRSKIKGDFEINKTLPNGNKYKIGLSEYDKKKGKHIEKHLTSLDGTKTDYVYADDKKGNQYFYYRITDKDNKILYKSEKKFKVLSPKHFQSTTDGINFDILFENDRIIITKLDGSNKKIEYKIKDFTPKDYKNFNKFLTDTKRKEETKLLDKELFLGDLATEKGLVEKYTVDKKFVNILKNLSGSEWFSLSNSNVLTLISDIKTKTAHSMGKGIQISPDEIRLSTLEHEIGHEKFNQLKLCQDENLSKIYNEEKDLFLTNLPNIVTQQAGYFMRNVMSDGLSETAAEANLIVNAPQQWENIGSRTMFLQQYFPRTIAYIANRHKELY